MLEKAQSYYEHLLGLECDKACADITRCAGLAYDLEAFFNWQSVPFSLDNGDLKKFYTQKAVEAKSLKRAANRKAKREQQGGKQMAAITIEEAAPHIKELLKQWGYDFEPGRHNEYVCHFGKVCVRYGIDKDEAMKYADKEFGTNYVDTAGVGLNTLRQAIAGMDPHKILMGTDASWGRFELSIALVKKATDDEKIRSLIMGENICRLLNWKR